MSGKYYFKNIDITSIIASGTGIPGGNSYIGFPNSDKSNFIIEQPLNLSYKISSTDLATLCKSKSTTYNTNANGLTIPTGAKYISTICVGGGGGGGGGGGDGTSNNLNSNKGGDGGTGGDGGYAAIQQCPISSNSTINITYGTGGIGGEGGAGASNTVGNSGKSGNTGLQGNSTIVYVDGIAVCIANGGYGGNFGKGGGTGESGANGSPGVIGTGSYNTGKTGTNVTSGNYPPQNGGFGGAGSGGGNNSGAGDASPGNNGYATIFFLYE
jgi:hypothetical protein